MSELQEVLLNVLLGLLTIVGLYVLSLIKNVISTLREKAQEVKDANVRKLAIEAINRVEKLSEVTVLSLEGQVAKELREKVKQGIAPRSDLLEVGKEAFYEVKNMLGDQYMDALNDMMEDADTYIKSTIEAQLEKYKALSNAS